VKTRPRARAVEHVDAGVLGRHEGAEIGKHLASEAGEIQLTRDVAYNLEEEVGTI